MKKKLYECGYCPKEDYWNYKLGLRLHMLLSHRIICLRKKIDI